MKRVIIILMVLFMSTAVNATLTTEVGNDGNKAVVDSFTGLVWHPDPYFFVGRLEHQGNLEMVSSAITGLNANRYAGYDSWRLASVAEYNAMYWGYRATPEQIDHNFSISHSFWLNKRAIPYEERHFTGILADSVMAPLADYPYTYDIWVPGHWLAEMWFRTYYGEDEYLNKSSGFLEDSEGHIMGYMFGDTYKRADSNFYHYADPSYVNYGAWVICDPNYIAPMMALSVAEPEIQQQVASVPESSTWIMMIIGFGCLVWQVKHYA